MNAIVFDGIIGVLLMIVWGALVLYLRLLSGNIAMLSRKIEHLNTCPYPDGCPMMKQDEARRACVQIGGRRE